MEIPLALEFNLFPYQLFVVNSPIKHLRKKEWEIYNKIKNELKIYIKNNKKLIVENAITNNNLTHLQYLNRLEGGICTLDEKKQLRFDDTSYYNERGLNWEKLILNPSRGINNEYFTLEEMQEINEALCNEFREIISSPNHVESQIFVYGGTAGMNYTKYDKYSYDITNGILQDEYLEY